MRRLYPGLIALIFISSCVREPENLGTVQAYVPVYASAADVTKIAFEASKPTLNAGKIYAFNNYVYQNELNEGIHIIDRSNPTAPRKVGFLRIPFSTEIAIKGASLYSNNLSDLVVFDISDLGNPKLVKRMENVFPPVGQEYPPFSGVNFECVDPAKGVVVRWELKTVKNPACRR